MPAASSNTAFRFFDGPNICTDTNFRRSSCIACWPCKVQGPIIAQDKNLFALRPGFITHNTSPLVFALFYTIYRHLAIYSWTWDSLFHPLEVGKHDLPHVTFPLRSLGNPQEVKIRKHAHISKMYSSVASGKWTNVTFICCLPLNFSLVWRKKNCSSIAMAPTATAAAPKEDSEKSNYGIRAVLLGPPGAGKGTQVGASKISTPLLLTWCFIAKLFHISPPISLEVVRILYYTQYFL